MAVQLLVPRYLSKLLVMKRSCSGNSSLAVGFKCPLPWRGRSSRVISYALGCFGTSAQPQCGCAVAINIWPPPGLSRHFPYLLENLVECSLAVTLTPEWFLSLLKNHPVNQKKSDQVIFQHSKDSFTVPRRILLLQLHHNKNVPVGLPF